MSTERVNPEEKAPRFTDNQKKGQLNKFEESMHTIKDRKAGWDYFAKEFKEIRYPSEQLDAYVHYNTETENFGVKLTFHVTKEEDALNILRKLDKTIALLGINEDIEINKVIEQEKALVVEEVKLGEKKKKERVV